MPPHHLLAQGVDIRQLRTVADVGEPVASDDAVELALGGGLDGRVETHGEEEGFQLGGGLPPR
jgi:hypothetical protein